MEAIVYLFSLVCYITQSLTFFLCLVIYVIEKCLQMPCSFLSFKKKHDLDMRCLARYVSPVQFTSFSQKVAIDFC